MDIIKYMSYIKHTQRRTYSQLSQRQCLIEFVDPPVDLPVEFSIDFHVYLPQSNSAYHIYFYDDTVIIQWDSILPFQKLYFL